MNKHNFRKYSHECGEPLIDRLEYFKKWTTKESCVDKKLRNIHEQFVKWTEEIIELDKEIGEIF